jgi:hypothetical protein
MTNAVGRAAAAVALAGCGTFVDPTDPDFTPGTVVLPGDSTEIVALQACDDVSFTGLAFESLGLVPEVTDRLDPGPDGKTGVGPGPDNMAGTEDDEDFTEDDVPFRIKLGSFDYAFTWDGSNASDILVRSAAAYPEPLDSDAYETLAGAVASCTEGAAESGRRVFYCGDVEDALVPQPLGARCSGSYVRANATDYLPKTCVEPGVGWNLSETRLSGLRAFAKRAIVGDHPYDVTIGAWCADGDGTSRFVSVTERLVTPSYLPD